MSEEPSEKPKLIIDDDWKAQVQSEKEAAAAESAASKGEASDAETKTETSQTEGSQDEAQSTPELPPASFATLVHSLTAQALSSLGQIPDAEGKTRIEIGLGKHFIDTLVVLEEKTKGNLDQDEAAALSKMLHELRMLFVHVRKEQSGGDDSATESPSAS
jgi:hypothetical protein